MSRYTIKGFKYEADSPMARLQEFEDKAEDGRLVEVRHGEWVKFSAHSDICCNLCKRPPKIVFGVAPLYCPNCGAKMDGEGSENGK